MEADRHSSPHSGGVAEKVAFFSAAPVTAVILGETGAGKSSLIELLAFWSRNSGRAIPVFAEATVSTLAKGAERDGTSQSVSQTQRVTEYSFALPINGSTYNLHLIDTPGMGDTSGISEDDSAIDQVLDKLGNSAQPLQLHAVVLMLNGSNCRVTARTNWFQTLSGKLFLRFQSPRSMSSALTTSSSLLVGKNT
ncbi:hypothetical protein Pelo_18234 [Pelomyxa schiedti]|nr:hypothetical protein Pelo_18234 [Pelomyxa schiedti]